jgi:hypothetical protein
MTIAIVAVVLAGALFAFAWTRPDTFAVQRSTTVGAPPERVFELVDDLRQWVKWTPLEKPDSRIQRTYSGPSSGRGAVAEWHGEGSTGGGRMEITESLRPTKVTVKVDFVKPFEAHNVNAFMLKATGDGTHVTWSLSGTNSFFVKGVGLFMNMDRMFEKHCDAGLANLKALAEARQPQVQVSNATNSEKERKSTR